jgi:hypothetical protein
MAYDWDHERQPGEFNKPCPKCKVFLIDVEDKQCYHCWAKKSGMGECYHCAMNRPVKKKKRSLVN